jgi:transposase
VIGYDGFKRCGLLATIITGTKIHVAVNQNSLPVSIMIGPANQHDSTRFVDVMENLNEHLDDDTIRQIKKVYADKGYDSKTIRNYLKNRNIVPCIPERKFNTKSERIPHQTNYNKTRFVVERFFAWLKCGFHRTRIRYERKAENYLGLIHIASFLMYWRVLG